MNNISFAWTTPAVRIMVKCVTRREWKPEHAKKFHKGDLVGAYTRQPRYGGAQFGIIRLLRDPYEENTRDVPEEDYRNEGFEYLHRIGAKVNGLTPEQLWRSWHLFPQILWVIRFEVVEIFPD